MSGSYPSKWVTVQFKRLEIINDQDGWLAGAGEIYLRYWINNGDTPAAQGTLPGVQPNGEPLVWSLSDGEATNDLAGPHARFLTNTSSITVQTQVWDDDAFLTFSDDKLDQDLNATFYRSSNYGAGEQSWRTTDYRLFYTITAVNA